MTLLSDPAFLSSAIRGSVSGTVVEIPPGEFPTLDLRNLVRDQETVIAAETPGTVRVAGLSLTGAANLTFEGINFEPITTSITGKGNCLVMSKSADIKFVGCEFGNADPSAHTGVGASVRESKAVTFSEARFRNLYHGLYSQTIADLMVENSRFFNLHGDAARGFLDCDGVIILENEFTDLFRVDANHPDAIQFWTSGGTVGTRNVLIKANVLRMGKGTAPQFIFIKDESRVRPYRNLVVEENVGAGIMYHGVSIDGAIDPVVRNNFVQGLADAIDPNTGKPMAAKIILRNSEGGQLIGNMANSHQVLDAKSPPTVNEGNVTIPMAAASDYTALEARLGIVATPTDPVPADDTRDAQIAELKALLQAEEVDDAALIARSEDAEAQLAEVHALLSSEQSSAKAVRDMLAIVTADREDDRTALTAIEALAAQAALAAQTALASHPAAT